MKPSGCFLDASKYQVTLNIPDGSYFTYNALSVTDLPLKGGGRFSVKFYDQANLDLNFTDIQSCDVEISQFKGDFLVRTIKLEAELLKVTSDLSWESEDFAIINVEFNANSVTVKEYPYDVNGVKIDSLERRVQSLENLIKEKVERYELRK